MTESLDSGQRAEPHAEAIDLPGSHLREEREARGLSVREVASELHVDSRLLQSLESDDFETLGAPIFVKGHLRNYARLLGLDPEPLLAGYERSSNGDPPALRKRQGEGTPLETASDGAFAKMFGWVFIALLLIASAGWWYYQQEAVRLDGSELRVISRQAAEESVQVAEPEEVATEGSSEGTVDADPRARLMTPIEVAGQEAAEVQDTVSDEVAPADQEPATRGQVMRQPEAVARPPAREASTPEPQRNTIASTGPSSISLSFSDASWVEVYDEEDQPLLYDLVPAGSVRDIMASGSVRVFLGNAPAVGISVNGKQFDVGRYTRRDNTARFSIELVQGQ